MTGTKKQTDANSILGAARRAQDVPRPVESQDHTTTQSQAAALADQPVAQAATRALAPGIEKRVNVAIPASLHKAYKLRAVEMDRTVQDLVTEALTRHLADLA